MTTITLTVPEELAEKLDSLDQTGLVEILQKGLAQHQAEQTFGEYLRQMQTDDVLAATHQAKKRSHAIIEDQGFAAVALLFTDFLADTVQHAREDQISEKATAVR